MAGITEPDTTHVVELIALDRMGLGVAQLFAIRAEERDIFLARGVKVGTSLLPATVSTAGQKLKFSVHLASTLSASEIATPGALNCIVGNEEFALCTLSTKCEVSREKLSPYGAPTHIYGETSGSGDEMVSEEAIFKTLADSLSTLGMLYGIRRIVLHHDRGVRMYTPIATPEGTVRVFLGMTPGKSRGEAYPSTICGMDVEVPGVGYYQTHGYFPGHGVVLSDGETPLVQVMGNCVYVLYDSLLLAKRSAVDAFKLTIALLALYLRYRSGEDAQVVDHHLEECTPASLPGSLVNGRELLERDKERALRKIRSLEEELVVQRRMHAEYVRFLQIMSRDDASILERMHTELEEIRAMHFVSQVQMIPDEGLEVMTGPICIMHEGAKYDIGDFGIRLSWSGEVFVYATRTTHPDKVPHPHISLYGVPCFGNVGSAITDALGEYRYADAISYIHRWLTEGYTPELIIGPKVNEWSRIDNTERSPA